MTIMDGYVTLREAAARTGLSYARVLQMVHGYMDIDEKYGRFKNYSPVVPAVRVGRDWFVKEEDLRLIEERRRAGWIKGRPRRRTTSSHMEPNGERGDVVKGEDQDMDQVAGHNIQQAGRIGLVESKARRQQTEEDSRSMSYAERPGPDWETLCAHINELAVRKGLCTGPEERLARIRQGKETGRLREVSYRKLGEAIGRSSTVLYGIIGRYHRPSAETLAALADYAAQEPRIPHLADRGGWLKVGGVIKDMHRGAAPDMLCPIDHKMQGLWQELTDQQKEKMFGVMEALKAALL